MAYWTIRAYGNASGRDVFCREYRSQLTDTRAEFRAKVNLLKSQPTIEGWSRINGFDRLSKQYRELGKLRFKADNAQHRPLGFFGPHKRTFTLLVWATERDGKYYPPGVRGTALDRMAAVIANPELAYDADF